MEQRGSVGSCPFSHASGLCSVIAGEIEPLHLRALCCQLPPPRVLRASLTFTNCSPALFVLREQLRYRSKRLVIGESNVVVWQFGIMKRLCEIAQRLQLLVIYQLGRASQEEALAREVSFPGRPHMMNPVGKWPGNPASFTESTVQMRPRLGPPGWPASPARRRRRRASLGSHGRRPRPLIKRALLH